MRLFNIICTVLMIVLMPACKSCKNKKANDDVPETPNTDTGIENVLGYSVLNKVKGIWNGPVTSTTPLGGYPEWIVDFRPISENQISAKNELDTLNDIHMSFFIAKYNNQYKVAFRNGGSFAGNQRVSYFLCDSVSETTAKSFYRFSEILIGKNRAYTEVILKQDSLIIKSYTNRYNTQANSTPHMVWSAKLQDTTSANAAVSNFNFPKQTLTKDFSSVFVGQTEAVYYNSSNEPYPESTQPYLGNTTVNYSFASNYTPLPNKKVLLIITTQPLFNGFVFNSANLKYRSRYVILTANDLSYTFNYMHPGSYHLHAFYDNDGNNLPNSGDWLSSANPSFTLGALGTSTVSTQINFTIP